MRKDIAVMLLGMGFSNLSQRRRKLLYIMLVSSLVIHIVGLLILGGIVVMRSTIEQRTVFVASPPIKTYEPRQLEHQVKVQKRQRSSSRPSMVPRMVSMKESSLSLPKIEMDPKIITTSFQPKFKAISGKGLGVGVGTGYGLGGFGGGVSAFNFFGIRGRGDRIAILVDVSVSMVEEERGGFDGFNRVRNRINQVVEALHEGAFFNMIVFADAASIWKDQMVIASEENKNDSKRWLRQFNTPENYGLEHGNLYPRNLGAEAAGGTTRLDIALTGAFEQGADTILVISDGLPMVEKPMSASRQAEHDKVLARWEARNAAAMAAWENAPAVEKKVWVPPDDGKIREGKKSRGPQEGHWDVRKVRRGNRPTPPPAPEPEHWTLQDFVVHLSMLNTNLYEKKGKKPPVIHCIGYQIDREGGPFLRQLTNRYKGNYRRVGRLQ